MALPDNNHTAHTHLTGVVTVSYGSGESLSEFLQSLRQWHDSDLPVVVVDNKPGVDGVQGLAEQYGAIYLPLPQNPGYGAGMNAGAALLRSARTSTGTVNATGAADFECMFFCNPDVVFTAPSINELAQSLIADEAAGSIGPRTLNEDGSVYPSARNIPSVATGIGHALFSKLWPQNPWSRAYKNSQHYDTRRSAGSLSGAAVMAKLAVFDEIGGWDEAYFLHFEDIDLGYRIGLAGYTNVYEPAVTVVHSGGHSLKQHSVMAEQAMTASAIRFMRKRYAGIKFAPIRWMVVAGLRARGAIRVRQAQRATAN